MEDNAQQKHATKHFLSSDNPLRAVFIILIISVILGGITGYVIASKGSSRKTTSGGSSAITKEAGQDTRTFRDFAEGVIKVKPTPKKQDEYSEGTHILEREKAVSVALTSSVVDLSLYEGKKVKVYGETQKAVKEGWLMDVGKVELLQ